MTDKDESDDSLINRAMKKAFKTDDKSPYNTDEIKSDIILVLDQMVCHYIDSLKSRRAIVALTPVLYVYWKITGFIVEHDTLIISTTFCLAVLIHQWICIRNEQKIIRHISQQIKTLEKI